MPTKPWYQVVTPREDLREGRPLDASEFAVHLDQVRTNDAPEVYRNPEQFFQRTFLTKNLSDLAKEVMRRLSGETVEANAVFNLATQFGGGKTHALALLYHLAKNGSSANAWQGVQSLLADSGLKSVPTADVAVFVGTEFDNQQGRGGQDGTPVRRTPWAEIAYQIGGNEALKWVADHALAPGGDVLRNVFPENKPCLILMDELMNYVSRSRRDGIGNQLYNFLLNLSEYARSHSNIVLVVSIPASEMEMTAEDHEDYQRFQHMLTRLGKHFSMSVESEASEIVRRRLFEWDDNKVSQSGKVLLNRDAVQACQEYASWVVENRGQLPQWFPIDNAKDVFADSYPFHPALLSVFERKWQTLPRFQRTRGILRLLALWVSISYQEGFKKAHRDPLIGVGTAPLDDQLFRSALFEQMGEDRLEAAVTSDICGKNDSHAIRLDVGAVDTIKKSRLHRKAASAVFFESNGGQTQDEATLPEIRMALAEPDLEIGNVETVLEQLESECYYFSVNQNKYKFSLQVNLNKYKADRMASIQSDQATDRVREEVRAVFSQGAGLDSVYFPSRSNEVPDRPSLSLVVLAPEQSMADSTEITQFVDSVTKEYGTSARQFKSGIIWAAPDSHAELNKEAIDLLAWEAIDSEKSTLRLTEDQSSSLLTNVAKARRDLRESVWRNYKYVMLLGNDNQIRTIDLGLIHSSAAPDISTLILNRLRSDGDIEQSISPNFLVRNWPPAFQEWSTRALRDAFFASPQFPRLLNADAIQETVAKGVTEGLLAYVGKTEQGQYDPFIFESPLSASEVEISAQTFVIKAEEAKKHTEPPHLHSISIGPDIVSMEPGSTQIFVASGIDQHGRGIAIGALKWESTGGEIDDDGVFLAGDVDGTFSVSAVSDLVVGTRTLVVSSGGGTLPPPPPSVLKKISWNGDIPAQKWMNYYMKVLAQYATEKDLKLNVSFEVTPEIGATDQSINETKAALRELGLDDTVIIE